MIQVCASIQPENENENENKYQTDEKKSIQSYMNKNVLHENKNKIKTK